MGVQLAARDRFGQAKVLIARQAEFKEIQTGTLVDLLS